MSGASSNVAAWFTLLEAPAPSSPVPQRPDDPRLAEVIEIWDGQLAALKWRRPVLVGFPQDEGVRRNGGRVGAAAAPETIRQQLRRLTTWNGAVGANLAALPPLDVGNVSCDADLEASQERLGAVVGAILKSGAVPIVLGGGHETAYGHFLGYVAAELPVAILNCDAHLDVRPLRDGRGHSGSPFRQALEHPTHPLRYGRYTCLGAQPQSVSRQHVDYVQQKGGSIIWQDKVGMRVIERCDAELKRIRTLGCHAYVTIDADVVRMADVPGVSAPNPLGFDGIEVAACALVAGLSPAVRSLDLVEINPQFDRDSQSVRWAAVVIWNFLSGLALRPDE